MEIPLNAQVECTDGVCGSSVFVLINPVRDQVTHVVVKENQSPNAEYIVPVDFVIETLAGTIRLRCSKAELEKMDAFIQTQYIQEMVPERYASYGGGYGEGSLYYMPYTTPEIRVYEKEDIQQIPPGELTVRRGTRVEATDGFIGKVDEFVINPKTDNITHLVMREGHLWGKKDVIIPISALSPMGKTYQDIVFLKLDKHQVESLPTFPLHRLWN
jgi:sporulation protein YlmC with PRC-barrel domain